MKRMLAFLMLFSLVAYSHAFAQGFESPRLAYGFSAGGAMGDNDNADKWVPQYQGFLQYRLVPQHLLGQVGLGYTKLRASGVYEADIVILDNRFLYIPFSLPNVNPYVYAGFGVAKDLSKEQNYMPVIPFGLGMQSRLTDRVMLQISGGYNLVLSDKLSETKSTSTKRNTFTNGKHDGFYGFLIGLTFTGPSTKIGSPQVAPTTTQPVTTQPIITAPRTAPQPVAQQPAAPQPREAVPSQVSFVTVYFDFDQSYIREDQFSTLARNAQLLEKQNTISVRLEGNCDERGTEEYNMELGQRRADSVREYLVNYGIQSSRMTTVSYGEMRPVATGHDEAAFAQNRRCDIVITSR